MSTQDVSGIFSRYFVMGFFLPSFFGLVALSQAVSDEFLPHALTRYQSKAQIFVLAGAALLVGLLLLGLNYPIIRLFEGYPLTEASWLAPLKKQLLRRERRARLKLARDRRLGYLGKANRPRAMNAWYQLDWRFPARSRLLPTRFGNAIRASEDYALGRWGLDFIGAWPRIDPLLSDQERELHTAARTDLMFFVNSAVVSLAAGIVCVVDAALHAPFEWWLAFYVFPFGLAYLLYRCAIGAALRWGNELRASTDLHRLELYERLGVRRPASFSDERESVAPAVSRLLLYGLRPHDEHWRFDRSEPHQQSLDGKQTRASTGGGETVTEQFELRDDEAHDLLRASTPAGNPGTDPFEEPRTSPKPALLSLAWWQYVLRKDQEPNREVLS